MRTVFVSVFVSFALLIFYTGCPAPTPNPEPQREQTTEIAADGNTEPITTDKREPGTSETPDADEKVPETSPEPATEQTPKEGKQDGCPRGKLAVSGQGCIDFPKRELINRELSFTNATDKVELNGTLTMPKIDKGIRLPAIVILHGSGPIDRDATLPGALGVRLPKAVKVFRDIAEFFASKGYAVFRYDKRSYKPKDPGKIAKSTVDSFTQDASAALDMLKKRDDINPNDLTVMGHSQGGTLVLDLGNQRDDIKSVVILAGAASPLQELLIAQFKQIITWLKQTPPSAQRDQQIATYEGKIKSYEEVLPKIADGTYQQTSFDGAPTIFWKSWIDNHKRIKDNLAKLPQPLAAITGTLDFNTPPAETKKYEAWRGQRKGDLFKIYNNLTHPLVHVFGNNAGDKVYQPLLDDLLAWMNAQ